MTTLAIASDHAGFELKEQLIQHLKMRHPDITTIDMGPNNADRVDYPDFGQAVARHILDGKSQIGILVCGTGIGISISANRFKGIRAAVVHDEVTAEMAKAHNNANILCLGSRIISQETAKHCVDAWLKTPFEEGRHTGRIEKLDQV